MILVNVLAANITPAACQHNGLVIATHLATVEAVDLFLVGSEITAKIGTAEFVIEGSGA